MIKIGFTTPRRPWLLLCAAALAACGPSKPGTLAGDGYLVLDSGQEISLGGMHIGLVPEAEQLDSLLAALCPRRAGQTLPADSAAQERAWHQRAQLLAAPATHTTTSDRAARFAIDSIAPGQYRVWADTSYGGTRWTWLQPVKIAAGDSARVTLSNGNPDENPFRCKD